MRRTIADARSEWSPAGVYLNTASFGLPPRAGWDALQSALGDWHTGSSSWEGWGNETQHAREVLSDKLRHLEAFTGIKDYPLPGGFSGKLRPYQKAGYNWLRFLNEFHLGGCLADDMGLGKTVQTLTLLQSEKEKDSSGTSLLVMPTSLTYNWEMEAAKFTPQLKILNYTGTLRNKDIARFEKYDVVITSYGITRLDIESLQKFFFNYIILDESQVIKNPSSNIAKAVLQLRSRHKLTLTGTPLENTTLDLWSQMTFINPGLLMAFL